MVSFLRGAFTFLINLGCITPNTVSLPLLASLLGYVHTMCGYPVETSVYFYGFVCFFSNGAICLVPDYFYLTLFLFCTRHVFVFIFGQLLTIHSTITWKLFSLLFSIPLRIFKYMYTRHMWTPTRYAVLIEEPRLGGIYK